jgi:hypothetical protein
MYPFLPHVPFWGIHISLAMVDFCDEHGLVVGRFDPVHNKDPKLVRLVLTVSCHQHQSFSFYSYPQMI